MTAPDDATVELAKRQSHVAGPARAAFDELVSVGKDGEGGYGAMRLTAEAGSTYAAFEGESLSSYRWSWDGPSCGCLDGHGCASESPAD